MVWSARLLSEDQVFIGAGLAVPSFIQITWRQPDSTEDDSLQAGSNQQAFTSFTVPEANDEAKFLSLHNAFLVAHWP